MPMLPTPQDLYKVDQVLFVDELASTVKGSGPEKVYLSTSGPKISQVHMRSPNNSRIRMYAAVHSLLVIFQSNVGVDWM